MSWDDVAKAMRDLTPVPDPGLRGRVLASTEDELAAERGSALLALYHSTTFWMGAALLFIALCAAGTWQPTIADLSADLDRLAAAKGQAKELAELTGDGQAMERAILAQLLICSPPRSASPLPIPQP